MRRFVTFTAFIVGFLVASVVQPVLASAPPSAVAIAHPRIGFYFVPWEVRQDIGNKAQTLDVASLRVPPGSYLFDLAGSIEPDAGTASASCYEYQGSALLAYVRVHGTGTVPFTDRGYGTTFLTSTIRIKCSVSATVSTLATLRGQLILWPADVLKEAR